MKNPWPVKISDQMDKSSLRNLQLSLQRLCFGVTLSALRLVVLCDV